MSSSFRPKEESGAIPDEAIPGVDLRCAVRPELSELAQICASRDVPRKHKFRYDPVYIENQSLWLDLSMEYGLKG